MFIAVINEGFAVAEEEKQKAQIQAFVKRSEPQETSITWISRLNPYRYFPARPDVVNVASLPKNLVLPLGPATVREYMNTSKKDRLNSTRHHASSPQPAGSILASVRRLGAKKPQRAESSLKMTDGIEEGMDVDSQLWVPLNLLCSTGTLISIFKRSIKFRCSRSWC